MDPERDDDLTAHSDHSFSRMVPGIIILMDLDGFKEYTMSRGLDQYTPNLVTGELTRLVESFAIKYNGVIVYGLDYERGTEEALIEIPFGCEQVSRIIEDLRMIKEIINTMGVGITIVVIGDYVIARPARDRREAYFGTLGRKKAVRIIKRLKKKGGNTIYVEC